MANRHIIYKIYKQTYILAAVILASLAVSSCASDGEVNDPTIGKGEPVTVGIALSAKPMENPLTRADYPKSPLKSNELIGNLYVAFVKEGVVVEVVKTTYSDGRVSKAPVDVKLIAGNTYTAYAFANLPEDYIETDLGLKKNNNVDDNMLLSKVYKNTDKYLAADSDIPMTGHKTFTVSRNGNEGYAIELVRMYSKVEFAFVKKTDVEISVNSITLQPINTGNIMLMPVYLADGASSGSPALPSSGVAYEPITPTMVTIKVPEDRKGDVAARTHFYIRESVATGNHPTDRFHIGLNLERGSGDDAKEDVSYALGDKQLQYFNRNDYVLFPITISDYVPEFEVTDYPPIGGYPVTVESKGTEFYARFSSSGSFDIKARLRDGTGKTVAIKQYDGTNTQDNYVRFVSSDNKGFKLTYDSVEEAWCGIFDVSEDPDKHIVLTFEFKINSLIYSRTLHLVSY